MEENTGQKNMPKFIKSDSETITLFEDLIQGIEGERKKMFGYPTLFINGNMLAGTFENRLFFRVRIEEQKNYLDKNGAIKVFEPMKNRKMKEYLEIGCEKAERGILEDLIREAKEYVRGMVPKKART